MSGGAYNAGDLVELDTSQLEREGSLSELGLMGSILIPTEVVPSLGKDPGVDDWGSLLLSDCKYKKLIHFLMDNMAKLYRKISIYF